MTDSNDPRTRRHVLKLAGTAAVAGTAGCLGGDDGDEPVDPSELTAGERMEASQPADVTPRNGSSGDVPDGIADAYDQIRAYVAESEPNMFISPNSGRSPVVVDDVDANDFRIYQWNLPSGDETYSFHRAQPTHPDGEYSDLSDVVDGSDIVGDREEIWNDFDVALGSMTTLTMMEMGDYARNQVADGDPYVIGADHVIYDQESNTALAVEVYNGTFETLAEYMELAEEEENEERRNNLIAG